MVRQVSTSDSINQVKQVLLTTRVDLPPKTGFVVLTYGFVNRRAKHASVYLVVVLRKYLSLSPGIVRVRTPNLETSNQKLTFASAISQSASQTN